jgi:helix-turn-helix protein
VTQCDRVLSMLKAAGSRGVRSDTFYEAYLPRAAARIRDLKDQGYEIASEREGKFCRYTLVRIGSGGSAPQGQAAAEERGVMASSAPTALFTATADSDESAAGVPAPQGRGGTSCSHDTGCASSNQSLVGLGGEPAGGAYVPLPAASHTPHSGEKSSAGVPGMTGPGGVVRTSAPSPCASAAPAPLPGLEESSCERMQDAA